MSGFQLWDVEKTESIPAEDARDRDGTLFDVAVSASLLRPGLDPGSYDRARRILDAEFALLQLTDGTTTLVERISDRLPDATEGQPEARFDLEYLIVG